MRNKLKDIILIIAFLIIIIFGMIFNIFDKDESVSVSERRHLKQFPELKNIFSGTYSNDFEEYAMDQFVLRDNFRGIKEFVHFNIFKQKDNNGLFIVDNSIYKQTGVLNEKEINKAVVKYKEVKEKYFKESENVYFSIIPDKNYFLENNLLNLDYDKLENIMVENLLSEMTYIDIFDTLNKDCYYKTDLHWKQESLENTVNELFNGLNVDCVLTIDNVLTKGEFVGAYGSQLVGNNIQKDEIKYVVNDVILNSETYNFETNKYNFIYDEEKWNKSSDKYDYYLSGATPIIEIKNNLNTDGKELIIFRDSFSSSLAPLLLQGYSKITLIDLRYIYTDYIGEFVDFSNLENKDILFINSTVILNEASILK